MDSYDDEVLDHMSRLMFGDTDTRAKIEDSRAKIKDSAAKIENTRLMEFFSVIYLGHDELTPDKQLGTIMVNDNLNVHYLYNVDTVDMSRPSIKFGDEIVLTGPNVAPILGGITAFHLDLFGGTYKARLHFDRLPDMIEFEPLKWIIRSKDGTGAICVLYSVFEDVLSAHVECKVTDIDPTVQVYGVVAASTSKIEHPEYTSILFLNKPQHRINLRPGDRIPLSRSIVAVPLESRLYLDVHLRDDKNDEIVKGSVVFSPGSETILPSQQIIGSDKGKIEVNVNWKGAALSSVEKKTRNKNELEFVLKFFCESMNQPGLSTSVIPL